MSNALKRLDFKGWNFILIWYLELKTKQKRSDYWKKTVNCKL